MYLAAASFRLAVEIHREMQYRIRRSDQQFVLVVIEPEAWRGQIAAENVYARREVFAKSRKVAVQLQRMPQPALRFLDILCANQQIQRFAMVFEKPRC